MEKMTGKLSQQIAGTQVFETSDSTTVPGQEKEGFDLELPRIIVAEGGRS